MNKGSIPFILLAAIAGFLGGFMLANKLNGSEMHALRAQMASGPSASPVQGQNPADATLSDEELRAKITEADQNPDNFEYQKSLGIALYRYADMKRDVALLGEAKRILERAHAIDLKDFDVLVALGNTLFDIGFHRDDAVSFQAARIIYARALRVRPGDPDVMTDSGITYFLQEPPDLDKAAAELQKVSADNPRHWRSVQFLVRVLIRQNKVSEAEAALTKLKTLNPGNSAIGELTDQLAAAKAGAAQ